jgi:RNA-directed DNA polymerase
VRDTSVWRLAPEKTRVVHIQEGFDFLGYNIRRQRKRGTSKHYVYTRPSKKAIQAVKDKEKAKAFRSARYMDPDKLIMNLNRSLRGWANSGTECPRRYSPRSTTTHGVG